MAASPKKQLALDTNLPLDLARQEDFARTGKPMLRRPTCLPERRRMTMCNGFLWVQNITG